MALLETGQVITGVSLSGNTLTLDFNGRPGVTDWKIMAGTDLQSFPIDETPGSISEGPPGVYQALVAKTTNGVRGKVGGLHPRHPVPGAALLAQQKTVERGSLHLL